MALDVTTMERITEMFHSKGWGSEYAEGSLINKFCSLMEVLSSNQRELLFELTGDFLWVRFYEYQKYIIKALDNMFPAINEQVERIYVYPLVESVENKSKSAKFIAYALNDHEINNHRVLRGKETIICDKLASIPKRFKDRKEVLLVVDDFIGSGETAITGVGNILKEERIVKEKVFLLTLVGQADGIKAVEGAGIKVFCGEARCKGISDKYSLSAKEAKRQVMVDIEKIVKPKEDYRFGYKRTEALVSMIRTPNNTFPVYWLKFPYNKTKIIPPFERK